jgi:hypothetical protein
MKKREWDALKGEGLLRELVNFKAFLNYVKTACSLHQAADQMRLPLINRKGRVYL